MCACIDVMNKELAKHNGFLEFNVLASPPRALICVTKLHLTTRIKPPRVEATFCPFCGKKYAKKKELARLASSTTSAVSGS